MLDKIKKIYNTRNSLKFKLLSGFLILNFVLSCLLGYTLYLVSNNIYYKSFLLHKKSLGLSISNSINGEEFAKFTNEESMNLPEFKRYLQFFKSIATNEEYITWIYSLNYDEKKDKLFYAIDASPSLEDTIWIENEFIGIKLFVNKSGKLSMYYDSMEFEDSLKINFKNKTFKITLDQDEKIMFINNEKFIQIISTSPLIGETSKGIISKDFKLQSLEVNALDKEMKIEKIPVSVNFSAKSLNASTSIPGWEFVETEEMKTRIKNSILTCTFHMPNEPEQVAYGTFITIIAPITKNNNRCQSAVLFSVSVQDIKTFKSKMAMTGITITIIAFIITLIISYILSSYFTEPLIKLTTAVESVSSGNFDINLFINSKDEFGYISEKFNDMVQNLKRANLDKESFVAISHELDVAKKIQVAILPKKIPVLTNLEIAVNYFPMAQVGGDFYDFHIIDKDKIGIFIADVSGHGVPAAIIASMLKIAFSIQSAFADDPARVLSRINKSMLGNVGQNFVSASYIYLDLENNIMRHARAGHPSIFLHSNEKMQIEEFNLKGKIIGMFPEINCENIEVQISKGDRIVMYTDGIIEARNSKDEMFGEELFTGYIRKHIALKPGDFAKLIMSDVKSWVGNNSSVNRTDDITVLVVDIK